MAQGEDRGLQQPHKLSLDERKKLTVSGVGEVVSFEENAVVLRTSRGTLLVRGQDLHLKTLSLDGGQVAVDGTVTPAAPQVGAVTMMPLSAFCSDTA